MIEKQQPCADAFRSVCKGVLQTELSLDFLDVKFGHLSSFTFELRLLITRDGQ